MFQGITCMCPQNTASDPSSQSSRDDLQTALETSPLPNIPKKKSLLETALNKLKKGQQKPRGRATESEDEQTDEDRFERKSKKHLTKKSKGLNKSDDIKTTSRKKIAGKRKAQKDDSEEDEEEAEDGRPTPKRSQKKVYNQGAVAKTNNKKKKATKKERNPKRRKLDTEQEESEKQENTETDNDLEDDNISQQLQRELKRQGLLSGNYCATICIIILLFIFVLIKSSAIKFLTVSSNEISINSIYIFYSQYMFEICYVKR